MSLEVSRGYAVQPEMKSGGEAVRRRRGEAAKRGGEAVMQHLYCRRGIEAIEVSRRGSIDSTASARWRAGELLASLGAGQRLAQCTARPLRWQCCTAIGSQHLLCSRGALEGAAVRVSSPRRKTTEACAFPGWLTPPSS